MSRPVLRLVLDVALTITVAYLLLSGWFAFLSGSPADGFPEGFRVLFNFMDVGLALWLIPLMFVLEFLTYVVIRPLTLALRIFGNMFAGHCISGDVKNVHTVRTGIEYMISLAEWYSATSKNTSIGFYQIGGGIAGDFPICVVPMLRQDLEKEETPLWGYFCQVSDSTTSYGSYSGAIPNEKITWEKLGIDTPKFVIESDASIVAPLMFAMVLGW